MITSPGVYRNLASTEGSVQNGPGSAANEPTWTNLSMGTYNGNIRNGKTGGKRLDLPLVSAGRGSDRHHPPAAAGRRSGQPGLQERYFGHQDTSLRILLSDTGGRHHEPADGRQHATPVQLDGDWTAAPPNNGAGAYGPVDATHPPMPWSPGPSPAGANATGTVTVWRQLRRRRPSTSYNANGIPRTTGFPRR